MKNAYTYNRHHIKYGINEDTISEEDNKYCKPKINRLSQDNYCLTYETDTKDTKYGRGRYNNMYNSIKDDFSPQTSVDKHNYMTNKKTLRKNQTNKVFACLPNNKNGLNTYGQTPRFDDELIDLKFEELQNELDEKEQQIQRLEKRLHIKEDKLNEMDGSLKAAQNNAQNLSNVNSEYESLKKRFYELTKDFESLNKENLKLNERISAKDKINLEFQNLTQVTVHKFNHFEDLNSNLAIDNSKLHKELREIKQKIISIYAGNEGINGDSKDKIGGSLRFDIDLEILKIQDYYQRGFEENVKRLIMKYEKIEEDYKEGHKAELNESRALIARMNDEILNLKKEILGFKRKLEDQEKGYKEREFELKLDMDEKLKENEKLTSSYKMVQKEIKDIELEFKHKLNECNSKVKSQEERERKFLIELDLRNKKLEESRQENLDANEEIRKLEKSIKCWEKRVDDLETNLKKLSEEGNELRKEIEKKNQELGSTEEKLKEDVNLLLTSLEEMKFENDKMLNENEELRQNLGEAQRRIDELTYLIEERYEGLEVQLAKEVNQKESIQLGLNDFAKKAAIQEEKLNQKIAHLKKETKQLNEKIERSRNKYEQKIQTVSVLI